MLGDGDEFAGKVGFRSGEAEGGGGAAGVAAFLAEGTELAEAADVALAPGRDAVAEPVFLAGDLAAELVEVALSFGLDFLAPGLVVGESRGRCGG